MVKRKRSSRAVDAHPTKTTSLGAPSVGGVLPIPQLPLPSARRTGRRGPLNTNPDDNADVLDGKEALRPSPDADEEGEALDVNQATAISSKKSNHVSMKVEEDSDSPLSDLQTPIATPMKKTKSPTKSSIAAKKGSDEIKAYRAEVEAKKSAQKKIKKEDEDEMERDDPDGDEAMVEDPNAEKLEAARPPPVNSGYLPLPWKGRLGYACLNTYLRFSNPPVFSSRTCRIASIIEHRHPLKDPSQAEHATKNRPDKDQPPDVALGQRFVEDLGLANSRDVSKMLLWNEKYGIRFLRLSSEMFPFASHEQYGYKLAPFASEALAEAGRIAAKLGHRLTTHPGQFTQLGSPRPNVIKSAFRDLEYHDELLSLLNMPPQENRDAVMILHMGGTFGDKAATLDRFRENYARLSPSIQNRLVLENDDVSWSVHDLLPICEELNIPLVLDFHHHNIIFDKDKIREGTLDIMQLFPRIKATWDRKGIRQKMHYSEPTPQAITGSQRRKHNPRPATLPPCPPDMDLMIEAKDKEQAVFEVTRNFKLPGWETFNDIIPYERADDNKPLPPKAKKKKTKKQVKEEIAEFGKELSEEDFGPIKEWVREEDVGMGGPENRVYWRPGMEEWLRPMKREVKKKKGDVIASIEDEGARAAVVPGEADEAVGGEAGNDIAAAAAAAEGPARKKAKTASSAKKAPAAKGSRGKAASGNAPVSPRKLVSDAESEEDESMPDLSADEVAPRATTRLGERQSGRARKAKVSYREVDVVDEF